MCQVRVFSSREHTRALSASDVWAVVGWSGDLLPLAERLNDVVLVAPASGTALWADLWAVPWQAQNGSKVIACPIGSSPHLPSAVSGQGLSGAELSNTSSNIHAAGLIAAAGSKIDRLGFLTLQGPRQYSASAPSA